MTNEAEESAGQLQATQHHRHSGLDTAKLTNGYGPYQYYILTQDQIIAYVEGMRISGTFTTNPDDSQSDYTDAPRRRLESDEIYALLERVKQIKEFYNRAQEGSESLADEEITYSVAIEEQVGAQAVDTAGDDVAQWPSDQLASAIMDTKAESDMPRLREMIFVAEDTGFTVTESDQLAQWLLSFAKKYRDSSDPQDEAAVWSAIRTGASMLRPDAADCLCPLLEPGHSIETSLVTVKMLGRIFEAQPPAGVDEHQKMANEVYKIAESLLNPHAITASEIAAKAQLAIYALAAMASSKTESIVEAVQKLGVTWFTRRTLRKLRDLSNTWASHPTAVGKAPRQLLDNVLQVLEPD